MTESGLLEEVEHITDIFARMIRAITVDLTSEEITETQFQALRHIASHGPATVGSLAAGLSISQPAATMMVDRMEKRGLVTRQPGRTDRRQAEVSVSDHAESLIKEIEKDRAERLGRILEGMTTVDRAQLLTSLEGFVAAALKVETSAEDVCLRCGNEHHPGCIVNRTHIQNAGKEIEQT